MHQAAKNAHIVSTVISSFLVILFSFTIGAQASARPAPGYTAIRTSAENIIAFIVFQTINRDRAIEGLAPLQWSTNLVISAHNHNLTMQAANKLSHQLPGEAELGDRISAVGLNWVWAGENIGETNDQSTSGALGLHRAMMAEQPPHDGHRQNILTTAGHYIGVDIVIDNIHDELWLTEDFARI
jgi:uncharacterized protein YkwD